METFEALLPYLSGSAKILLLSLLYVTALLNIRSQTHKGDVPPRVLVLMAVAISVLKHRQHSQPLEHVGRQAWKLRREELRMSGVTYVSRVRVEPVEGRVRRAYLPIQEEPIFFGVHSEVAEHYGVSPEEGESHDTTLDYLVAAAGG